MGGISLREAQRCCSRRGESVGGRFIWRGGDDRWCLVEMGWEVYVLFREASSNFLPIHNTQKRRVQGDAEAL
jgi:hypothetical protein